MFTVGYEDVKEALETHQFGVIKQLILSARHLRKPNPTRTPTFRNTSQGRVHCAQIHNMWFRETVGHSTNTYTEPRRARATSGKAQHYHSARHSLAELGAARTELGAAAAARCAALRAPRRSGRPRLAPAAPLAAGAPPAAPRPARPARPPVASGAPPLPRALRASTCRCRCRRRAAGGERSSTLHSATALRTGRNQNIRLGDNTIIIFTSILL